MIKEEEKKMKEGKRNRSCLRETAEMAEEKKKSQDSFHMPT